MTESFYLFAGDQLIRAIIHLLVFLVFNANISDWGIFVRWHVFV